jgi:hypothetical protein
MKVVFRRRKPAHNELIPPDQPAAYPSSRGGESLDGGLSHDKLSLIGISFTRALPVSTTYI